MSPIPASGKPASVQEQVFTSLRSMIINLELPPNTAMSAGGISQKMGVSRTPVREAFIMLEQEGLVDIVPQSKTTVSRINMCRVRQEHFLRQSLEMAVLPSFCANCTADDLDKLRGINRLQREKTEQGNYIASIDCDDTFHRHIFAVAKQPLSWDTIEKISGHYRRCRLMTLWVSELSNNVILQHEEFIKQAARADYNAVKSLAEHHLQKIHSEEAMLRMEYPDYFI